MRALLVEDDPSTRLLLEKFLRSRGHEVTPCVDAETAWDCLERDTHELIVTDWMLPGMSGVELCRRLRDLQEGRQSVVLSCTARADPVSLQEMLDAGADDYLVKPVNLKLLAVRLEIAERRARDRAERRKIEQELRQAQKLEAVGQLAAGIAHEINTPAQYVGDNLRFLEETFGELNEVLESYRRLLDVAKNGPVEPEVIAAVDAAIEAADVEYLSREIPKAIQQSVEGVTRVATIVGAMKEFSHPGGAERVPVDINRAIASTVTVSCNEWKYVAELVTDFDPQMPLVPCLIGEFNQAILNMIVNAAHAIGDVVGDSRTEKGKITVSTRRREDWAEIRIEDTGGGISEEIKTRVFDPFFTTKEVGRGSGQGLAIAWSVIVDKHAGTIALDSEPGRGTTFTIRLPLGDEDAVSAEASV